MIDIDPIQISHFCTMALSFSVLLINAVDFATTIEVHLPLVVEDYSHISEIIYQSEPNEIQMDQP